MVSSSVKEASVLTTYVSFVGGVCFTFLFNILILFINLFYVANSHYECCIFLNLCTPLVRRWQKILVGVVFLMSHTSQLHYSLVYCSRPGDVF